MAANSNGETFRKPAFAAMNDELQSKTNRYGASLPGFIARPAPAPAGSATLRSDASSGCPDHAQNRDDVAAWLPAGILKRNLPRWPKAQTVLRLEFERHVPLAYR
jgi:hypothetical protein